MQAFEATFGLDIADTSGYWRCLSSRFVSGLAIVCEYRRTSLEFSWTLRLSSFLLSDGALTRLHLRWFIRLTLRDGCSRHGDSAPHAWRFLHILADYLTFPYALFILYLAPGALTAECCGVARIVPALALLDFAADCDLPWLFKLSLLLRYLFL